MSPRPTSRKRWACRPTTAIADQILIAPGTFTEDRDFEPANGSPETLEPTGSDPLTVTGAGPGATFLTSGATKNVFIVNLASNNARAITMRDLTVQMPDSDPEDGAGAALQIDGDTVLDNVDIVSFNEGSDGIPSAIGPGNVFRNGELRGEAGGSISQRSGAQQQRRSAPRCWSRTRRS